jgi:hypothetical protein
MPDSAPKPVATPYQQLKSLAEEFAQVSRDERAKNVLRRKLGSSGKKASQFNFYAEYTKYICGEFERGDAGLAVCDLMGFKLAFDQLAGKAREKNALKRWTTKETCTPEEYEGYSKKIDGIVKGFLR